MNGPQRTVVSHKEYGLNENKMNYLGPSRRGAFLSLYMFQVLLLVLPVKICGKTVSPMVLSHTHGLTMIEPPDISGCDCR